jgi:hypothetical protein
METTGAEEMDIQDDASGRGLRHDFTTQRGPQLGGAYRTGRRDLFQAGDTAVVVGTSTGVRTLARLLDG